MTDLLIVRHGIAFDYDPTRWPDDVGRPLTADGIEKFERAALGLRLILPVPQMVLVSPFTRAEQTAEILQRVAGWPQAQEEATLSSGMPATAALPALKTGAVASLAIVGHEPQLSELIGLLCGGIVDMKKGGVARLEVDGWVSGGATLLALLPPKAQRALRQG